MRAASWMLKLAGEKGFLPLSLNLNPAYVASHWEAVEIGAARAGRTPQRSDWRLVREVFVAETDAEAWRLSAGGMMGRMMREYFLPLLGNFGFLEFLKHDPNVADSDVTPEYCAEHNWLIGEEVMAGQLYGEAIRSMSHPGTAYDNPILGKDPQAADMSGYVAGGDPHVNSGIINRAFYLTAIELGTFPAARVWFNTLVNLWPNAQFTDCAYVCAEQARILARDGKVGRNAAQTVRSAFREVGVK